MQIKIERRASDERLKQLGVRSWPRWSKDASHFPWKYDASETCYFLDGEVTVIPEGGEAVTMGAGDLVTFPEGMKCIWEIHQPVNKHYNFD